MPESPYHPRTESSFEQQRNGLQSIIDTRRRLPEVPFLQRWMVRGFDEFDWVMGANFWPVAQELGRTAGDSEILIAVLDPDPVDYHKSTFGYYNWGALPIELSASSYWDFLKAAPASSPADSILLNSQVVALWAPSLKWAIWGERDSGLCVLASIPAMTPPSWKGMDWLHSLHPSAEWADFAQQFDQQFSRIPSL